MRASSVFNQLQLGLGRQLIIGCMVIGTMSVLVVKSGERDFGAVQAQVEGAAIKTNLGGLRTALAIDYITQQARAPRLADAGGGGLQSNPFLLLHRLPANYVGEWRAVEADRLPAGHWLFDPVCACIGYRPLYPEWLSSPSGAGMLWFDVVGAPGPLQLVPREAYVWKGESLT